MPSSLAYAQAIAIAQSGLFAAAGQVHRSRPDLEVCDRCGQPRGSSWHKLSQSRGVVPWLGEDLSLSERPSVWCGRR
ncbi:hypothetical protein MPNT_70061 [Candidatus Methylacidithermus pantelleriae]|uniref:Uncharacterized protein n=1 Tax=Candidatus Methylacidithermus pantelleriae TaxID=2744239 RepID=A0A8J2BN95_9BACT|nr:hypothetical protein MPNT_70061 [Candidatus Methylacidithermus pantelleriae]